MSISGGFVSFWINVMTSDGWEVKLGLVEREDKAIISPWMLAIIPVADPPRDVVGSLSVELIASSWAGNGYMAAGAHGQVKM